MPATMSTAARTLRLEQVDSALAGASACIRDVKMPRNGWVRSIRQALGMTTSQLAIRMGVAQPSVLQAEQRERDGGITLKALRRAAAAMDCELHYVLIPRTSLAASRRNQAVAGAERRLANVAHSMAMEKQPMSRAALRSAIQAEVERLLSKPRDLWT